MTYVMSYVMIIIMIRVMITFACALCYASKTKTKWHHTNLQTTDSRLECTVYHYRTSRVYRYV